MAKILKSAAPPEKVALYEEMLAGLPNLERKGTSVLRTTANGHIFSFLSKDGKMALRLPANEREKVIVKHQARLGNSNGVVQPEYVEVPYSLLSSKRELKKLFEVSYNYVVSLKPRPPLQKKKTSAGQ